MAEEDESVNSGAIADHAEQPAHPPTDSAPDQPAATPSPALEWTASDARGPLGEAEAIATEPAASAEATVPDATPEPASASPAPAPAALQTKRGSYWPVAVGLVVGAGVGAVVALWIYPAVQPPQAGPDPQLAASVAALSTKVAALEAKPTPDAGASALDAKSATKSLAALDAKITALQATVANLPAAAPPSPPPVPFDPSPIEQKIAAVAASVDTLKAQSAGTQGLATKVDGLGTAISGVQKQADTNASSLQAVQDQQKSLEGQQKNLEGQQKNLEGKVGTPALAVVAGSLVQQIDAGQPYEMQIDALASLGADPVKLALLKQNAATGVPSAKALAASFEPLAEPILATGHKAPPNASFMDRMTSGMSSLVSIHRTDDVSGNDLSSRVARIQADLAHDDLADTLATWTALPADAKAKADAWAAQVKVSAEAQAAARSLQSDAIAAMGGKKS